MKNIRLAVLYVVLWVPLSSFAQTDSLSQKKTSLTLSTLVSTNANYYGQTAEKSLPFAYLDLNLRTPLGWYISGGGYQLLTQEDYPSEMHVGTGFEFTLGKKAELNIGYTRSFYAKESPLLQASNPNSISAGFAFSHLFKTELSADFNFGKEEDFFLSLENSKNIRLGQFSSKDLIYFNPAITITMGTQRFYTTYLEDRGLHLGLLDGILPTPPNANTNETTEVSTDFNLLSYNLKAPFIYYRGNGALMLLYQLSVLSSENAQPKKANSFLSLGYFYQF